MSQRERKAPGVGTIAAAAPGAPAAVAAGLLRWPPADAAADRLVLWEDLFRHASPPQREHMLALAARQGFLYAHQVPAPNGKKPISDQDDAPAAKQLTRLLEGDNLPPVRPGPFTPWDEDLDRLQREAVGRALDTPDVCLIAGLPGTGKSRVVAEILTQAAQSGLRVLFLAPRATAIDHVLEQIGRREVLFPLRCLDAGERPETLPPTVCLMTFAERLRTVREAVPGAVRGKEASEQRCQRRRQEEATWPALRELAQLGENLERQRGELRHQQARLPCEVSGETTSMRAAAAHPEGTFANELLAEERRHQESLAEVTAALTQVEKTESESDARRSELDTEVKTLKPLAQAKQHGRWWTVAWWRAAFRGNVHERLADCQNRLETACAALASAREEAQILRLKGQELENEHQQALDHLQKAEVDRRLAELAAKETTLDDAGRNLQIQWHAQIEKLDREGARPATMTFAAVELAQERWQDLCREDEDSCAFACQWAGAVQEAAETLAQRLPALANLVAGTFAGFLADKHFAPQGADFDLLLVEDAHKINEADFLKLAGRAPRWVLVGEPPWEIVAERTSAGARERETAGSALPRSCATALSPLFHRLWQQYHCDLRPLPYAWSAEGDRLCCRLKPLRPEHRKWLESERVADRPEIELRIVSMPNSAPVLAEVVFPPAMSIVQAKIYIFKELEELPIQPVGRQGCWFEEADRYLFHLGQAPDRPATMMALEAGVREYLLADGVGQAGWYTCCLEFEKAAGWQRTSAEAWLNNHLGLTDQGRAVALVHPYRMQPDLAAVLSDLLFHEGGGRCPEREAGNNGAPRSSPPMVFVPVPSLRKRSAAAHFPKEGAGLELDLTATRGGDRLPAGLRAELPARGIVNYYEALALVRRLEQLVLDPGLAPAALPSRAAIGVVALYASQVELIRLLCRRSQILSKCPVAMEFGQPGDLSHREFPLVLCSLTRSHSFRAVSLGEEASALMVALTRAQARLIVFGDPGTLVRRSHWQGRLEHLDEHAAHREALCVSHLVLYLQGQGAFASAFHVDTEER